jgi:hypothetical protein
MILELSIMSGSALLMTALLVHKHRETSRGALPKIHEMREKLDPVLRVAHSKVNAIFGYMTPHHAWVLAHDGVVRGGKLFMLFLRRTHAVASVVVEKASRRKEDLSKGKAASFYLKQIADAKVLEDAKAVKGEIQG